MTFVEKLMKFALKRNKTLEIFANFLVFGVNQKSPEISTNTYRTKLNLCELNSMGNTLKVIYKFVAWKIFKKKPFDLNIFLFHMKYGRKMKNHLNRRVSLQIVKVDHSE